MNSLKDRGRLIILEVDGNYIILKEEDTDGYEERKVWSRSSGMGAELNGGVSGLVPCLGDRVG